MQPTVPSRDSAGSKSNHSAPSPNSAAFGLPRSGRVAITGASGFIGRALSRHLLAQGLTVHGLCRSRNSELVPGVERVVCDLLDRDELTRTFERTQSDYVFHLAGFTRATQEVDAVTASFDSNLAPTVNILTALTRVGCKRVVLAGSLEEPASTEAPASPYAASKAAGAMYARMFHQLYDTPAVVARIFMVYGPGQRDLRKLIPHTIMSLLKGEELKFSSGRREFDWIYIDDLVRGLAAMAVRPGIEGGDVDLGTGRVESVRSVVEKLIARIAPEADPRFGALPDRVASGTRHADAARSEALLGWRARMSIEDGLDQTIRYYTDRWRRTEVRRSAVVATMLGLCIAALDSLRWAERAGLTSVPFAA